ncbi:MAG: hypothetical protein CMO40_09575 [Verrucomicrobiaceae bacterium]|nr:hypothetical protein [Verrucomicrobiaceae bacterium]
MRISILSLLAGSLFLVSHSLHGQSQQEMNARSRQDLQKADMQLNAIYKRVVNRLPDEKAVELLRNAQRAWIQFRDAEAALYADAMRDGSAAPLLLYGRKTQLTRERIKHLQLHLEQYGGR